MCLSKSSVGFRAVSKVTSTNCWHSGIESTTKAQSNLHCLVRKNTPHIPADRRYKMAICYLRWFEKQNRTYIDLFPPGEPQFQVQPGHKPKSSSICLEALARPPRTAPEFMHSTPGSWWMTSFSQDYWKVGGGGKVTFLGWKNQRYIWGLISGIMTALNVAFLHAD